MGFIEHTLAVGAEGANSASHAGDTAQVIARCRGPGLAMVRTEHARITEGDALAFVLDGRPWSRRRLAEALGIAESIVRRWCSGEKPIPGERLRDACLVVWTRWQARLSETTRREQVAC